MKMGSNPIVVFKRSWFVVLLIAVWFIPAKSQDVVINEVAWTGTTASSDDEWIELFNGTDSAVDMEGWTLEAADGAPAISLTGVIPANDFFLLERTDDTTIGDVEADLIYVGALGNSGERLMLKDGLGQVIDEVDCSAGWFAGTNSPKATMERKSPQTGGSEEANWGTNDGLTMNGQDSDGNPIQGTPKSQNSVYDAAISPQDGGVALRSCALTPNYPNPFNPTTTVGFTLSERDARRKISLVVYSVLGEYITTLVDGRYGPGAHAVPWDGRDQNGKEVSSGIYFVSLQLDGQPFDTRCMLKMK